MITDGFSNGSVQASAATGAPADVLDSASSYETASRDLQSDLAFVYINFMLGQKTPAQLLIGPRYEEDGPEPSTSGLVDPYVLLLMRGWSSAPRR
jgi:hypothetical protein